MNTPKICKRNEFGLREDVKYVFREDNSVDWVKMLLPQHFVINKAYENQIVEKLGKPLVEVEAQEVEDHQKLTLLAGSRYLLDLRGFSKLKYSQPVYGTNGSVSVECEITFIPNYETDMRELVFSGIGEATMNNAGPIGKNKMGEWAYYLAATAENRAFVRCLRNALRISVLSKEEAQFETVAQQSQSQSQNSSLDFYSILQNIMNTKKPNKISFDILQKTIINNYQDKVKSDPSKWTSVKDIPPNDVFTIIGLLKGNK